MQDMSTDGKGTLPRPKLTVSNINGFVSALLLQNQQLNGATVIRRRVFGRFIDAVNFPGGLSPYSPDPSAAYPDQPWIVNRKITENPQIVQWELSAPIDLQGIKIPRRQIIANVCAAPVKYRDMRTCGYNGLPIADNANRTFLGNYGYASVTDEGLYNAATTYNQGNAVFVYSSLPQFSGIPIYYVCTTDGTVGISPVGNPVQWIPDQCSKNPAACKLRFGNTTASGIPDQPLRGGFFPGTSRANWTLSR
jgi:lambda family phage minor tail protein L